MHRPPVAPQLPLLAGQQQAQRGRRQYQQITVMQQVPQRRTVQHHRRQPDRTEPSQQDAGAPWRCRPTRCQHRAEHAERDRRHARQIGLFLPDLVAAQGGVRPWHRQRQQRQHRQQHHAAPRQQAHDREADVEHLLDRQRPQHVPVAWQVAGLPLVPVQVQAERGKDRARQRLVGVDDRVIAHAGQVQHAQHRHQRQQARHDAGETPRIECAHVDPLQAAPAAQRVARDQEPRDHEEHEHGLVAVVVQPAQQPRRQHVGQCRLLQRNAQAEMVEHHQHDRQPAQQVDAGVAGFSAGRGGRCRKLPHRKHFPRGERR